MFGNIFITRHGYDPKFGKHVKDPYLGDSPSIGACRPDFRKRLKEGDHIFVITGKIPGHNQYVMGGFEVAKKISAFEAYEQFPDQRLRKMSDGQLTGNIIIDQTGHQHPLDNHSNFDNRISNYIVGRNPICLDTDDEIERGRNETIDALREIMGKDGDSPIELVGRWGSRISESQILQLRDWLTSIKASSN